MDNLYLTIGSMYYPFDIAKRLKELRVSAKLTQEEFSECSGISYKFYQHIESGRKKLLRVDTIERVCAAYDIALWQFFSTKIPRLNLKGVVHRRR